MSNNGSFTFPMKQGVENIVEEDATKAALMRHNNTVTGLVVLCQGLKTEMGEDFICIDNEPWNVLPRDCTKPKAKLFREEVMRRHDVFNLSFPKPRTKNWTVEKCQQWLDKNPIVNIDKINYLKTKIAEHKHLQEEANSAKCLQIEAFEKNWVGKYPHMQLIHCLVDNDRIKQAYLRRNDLDTSRLSLENWNSDIQEPTVFEMISDCWNDPFFEPLTEELPDIHPDFQFSEKLSFNLVVDMAKAED